MAENLVIELEGFKELEKQFKPFIVRKGTQIAINKVAERAFKRGKLLTRRKYNITVGALNKKVKLRKSKIRNLFATIKISASQVNIASFKGAKQTNEGIEYSVIRGKTKTVKGAFFVSVHDIKHGRTRVKRIKTSTTTRRVIRKVRKVKGAKLAFKRTGPNRYPIKTVTDITAVEMFDDTGFEAASKIVSTQLDDLIMIEIEKAQDEFGFK